MDTPKSLTSASCMVALIENRSREIGFARLNLPSYQMTLLQFADSPTYHNTISTIYTWDPLEVVLSKTAEHSPLVARLQEHLPNIPLSFIHRRLFDEIRGGNVYSGCVNSIHDIGIESKYVCMAALGGLLHHIELSQSVRLHMSSLHITVVYLESMLVLDYFTARSLELVAPLDSSKNQSLASFFRCKTPEGGRLLRTVLLQPARDTRIVSARHEALAELRGESGLRSELEQCLQMFPNTELVAGRLLQQVHSGQRGTVKTQVLSALMLRNVFAQAKCLHFILGKYSVQSSLLQQLFGLLDDRRVDSLLNQMTSALNEDCTLDKRITQSDCLQALKAECDPRLALARAAQSKLLDEVYALASQVKTQVSDAKLMWNQSRGYYFHSLSEVDWSHAVHVTRKRGKTSFSTLQLIRLSHNLQEVRNEIFTATLEFLSHFLDQARDHITCLHNISYAVSIVDLLLAFARFSEAFACSLPVLHAPEFLVEDGVHPFLQEECVPLNYQLDAFGTVQLITGAHSSGKTTYLKTLGVLSILAHSGCMVPARKLKVPQLDQIFSVLGDMESLEHNSSRFLSAMQQFSYILDNCSEHSLVLVDEIANGTSHEDGVALGWALIEQLVAVGSFSLVTTHFSQLTELTTLYNSVSNVHMNNFTKQDGRNPEEAGYGLRLATHFGLPAELIHNAESLQAQLTATLNLLLSNQGLRSRQERRSLDVVQAILRIQNSFPPSQWLEELLDLQKQEFARDFAAQGSCLVKISNLMEAAEIPLTQLVATLDANYPKATLLIDPSANSITFFKYKGTLAEARALEMTPESIRRKFKYAVSRGSMLALSVTNATEFTDIFVQDVLPREAFSADLLTEDLLDPFKDAPNDYLFPNENYRLAFVVLTEEEIPDALRPMIESGDLKIVKIV